MAVDVVKKLQAEAAAVGLTIIGICRDHAYRTYRFIGCGHEREFATTAVRRGRVRCQTCLDDTIRAESAASGLELTGPSQKKGYRKYRFIDCGHELEAQTTHVRRANVRCSVCMRNKHVGEAANVGVEIIDVGSTAHTRMYRFVVCGHIQEMHVSAVRENRFFCQSCLAQRFATEALAIGLLLTGAGSSASRRRYFFKACGHEADYAPSAVRIGKVRCQVCIDERHTSEGAKEKLTILGISDKRSYKLYRFDNCGHERELTIASVRNGHVRCQICFDKQLRDDAQKEGLTLLGSASKPTSRLYRFACGHERELSPSAIRVGHVRCKICLDFEIKQTASEHGLTVLGPGRDANYRQYRFDLCGHARELSPSTVRQGAFFCRVCFDASLARQAHDAGVEILGPGDAVGNRKYRFLTCGHEQEMQPIHVRLAGFHCQTCNESAWEGQGNVYIVTLRRGNEVIFKVGLAKSVHGRVTRYGLKDDVDLEITQTTLFTQYRIAHEREQLLHAALRISGYGVATSKAREYLTNGFTECYSFVPDEIVQQVMNVVLNNSVCLRTSS